jgi:O-antigen biosynthesis protein
MDYIPFPLYLSATPKQLPLTLSIVIVNYNVKYFLEQCLHSVRKALEGIEGEVIVVDNYSTDGSLEYLQPRFPCTRFVVNADNSGFARACNQGLALSRGQYVLFLNPDTLLAEDTLHKSLRFMEDHPDAGAIGVRMVDGAGRFLKESKRSFPSPLTSLFKLFGFSRLFPRSRVFSRYHLGHLDEYRDHEVDVLAGAYMLVRRAVLDKVGAFDETFFMYGEDVDLSYRIQKAGDKNYYVAGAEIIHFKGESTKRGSLNYVRLFYSAMSKFVQKHYGGARAGTFRAAIQLAIWIRATMAAGAKFIKWIGLPIVDAALILLSFLFIKEVWGTYVRPDVVYPERLLWVAFPAYTGLYLLVAYYTGLYNKYYRAADLVRSTVIATLVLLSLYALLPEHLRFSRGILVFGVLAAFVLISAVRLIMVKAGILLQPAQRMEKPFILIAGEPEEFEEAKALLGRSGLDSKVIGRVAINGHPEGAVSRLAGVEKVARGVAARELIFCAGRLSYKDIITHLQATRSPMRLRFHAVGSDSIVGSDSSGTSGDVIGSETLYRLAQPAQRRLKRLVDALTALLLLLTFPLHLFFVKHYMQFLRNCLSVLAARKTWVGYMNHTASLPSLRPGVLAFNGMPLAAAAGLPEESRRLVDYWYARDYEPIQDLKLLVENYRRLGS